MGPINLRSNSSEDGAHRCFYAIRPDRQIVDYLAGVIRELRQYGADLRWVPEENLHVTLRFLGEITDRQLDRALHIGEETGALRSFSLGVQGLGAFPSLRSPSVVWAGGVGETEEDSKELSRLQQLTEEWAQKLGLVPDRRRYSAHITLGRVRRPGSGLKELMRDLTVRECRSTFRPIDRLLLLRSVLASSGAEYEVIGEWGLG
jgi:2'-5' RNA ligase